MGDLPHPIVKLNRTGNIALGTERQQAFNPSRRRVEKYECDVASIVANQNTEGRAAPSRRRRLVLFDTHLYDKRFVDLRLRDRWRKTAVDGSCRKMEEQID
jgi:hypothetical protein